MTVPGLREKVYGKVLYLTEYLAGAQRTDGSWFYCFESGTLTDAYMIILLSHLNMDHRTLIDGLASRIISREKNGTWKLFYDEPGGNLSATIEAYYALLLAGRKTKDDPEMKAAREFILSRGGLPEAGSLTRVMLALTGQYPWERMPQIPVELVLLPTWGPVNFFDLVGYARVHSAPVLICADQRYALKLPGGPDLSDLYPPGADPLMPLQAPGLLLEETGKLKLATQFPLPGGNNPALQELERYMLTRTEGDGTLYSYFTATFLMIFALLALGCDKRHPAIVRAVEGLERMICREEGPAGKLFHQQETTSTVWDTALLSYALQQAQMHGHPAVERAASFLWSRQQIKCGDWKIGSKGHPGGWGFSDSNTINPDVDDTAYALRALYRQAAERPETWGPPWRAGLDWLLSMQNSDGGWPAFERNRDKKWPGLLPMPDALPALTDPSSADLTGRALEFLGSYAGLALPLKQIQRGVQWLLKNQNKDGSWYGRWGICHIYGTWAAVTGLLAVGLNQSRCVEKAVRWLLSIQNTDGGWGESCLSDSARRYIPLGFSTPSQTAWAVDALIAAGLGRSLAVTRGIEALLELVDKDGIASYPTGQGLPGGFYINYHSYRYIWPLLAFGHYLKGSV